MKIGRIWESKNTFHSFGFSNIHDSYTLMIPAITNNVCMYMYNIYSDICKCSTPNTT